MNYFYEEPRHLNIKKVVIVSLILLIIIISIIVLIVKKNTKNEVKRETFEETLETSTVFSSTDYSVSLELPNTFGLKSYNSDYLLDLRSKNNLNIFISRFNPIENRTFNEFVEADKVAFLGTFDNNSNLSETKELLVNEHQAYTYSFHYLDKTLNTAFYLQVIWLEIGNNYYSFDIEFPLDDLSFNTNIVSDVLSNFRVNNI